MQLIKWLKTKCDMLLIKMFENYNWYQVDEL